MSNIGVFIDADNISAEMAEQAIVKLRETGNLRFVRAYGNWSRKPSSWKRLVNQYGVETTHRYNITRSKNAADISLTVDATASLYGSMDFDTLAVVSSDSDFLPLVQHAQACGKRTVGVGCRKAPISYTRQCGAFHYLDEPDVIELEAVSH
ncbi:MAG: NYN domain-containing protein [gamma proteobacterium symbiont of Clathrolucina costata]